MVDIVTLTTHSLIFVLMFVIVLGCAGQLCRLRIRGIVAIMEPDENLHQITLGKKTKRNSGELFFLGYN